MKIEPRPTSLSMVSAPRWRLTMCLTMARPRPVPPSCARAAGVDAVEALGQARQVLARRCPRPRRRRRPRPGGPAGGRRAAPACRHSARVTPHRAVGAAVLDRVVDQVLEHLRQLVGVADRPAAGRRRCRRRRSMRLGRAPAASARRPRRASMPGERDRRRRRRVLVAARSATATAGRRPAATCASAWSCMIAEEALARARHRRARARAASR